MRTKIKIAFFSFLALLGAYYTIGSAATPFFPYQGGTGTSTAPTIGQVLVGRSDGTYGPQATSTLGLGGSGGSTTTINSVDGPTFFLIPSTGIGLASSSNQFTFSNNGVLSWNGATGTVTFNPYAAGFITASSTSFATSSTLYLPGFITATSTQFGTASGWRATTTVMGISGSVTFSTTTNQNGGFNISSSSQNIAINFPLRIDRINNLATTTGGLIVASSSPDGWGLLAVGTNGKVLTASSTAPSGISWETAAAAGSGTGTVTTSTPATTGYFPYWGSASGLTGTSTIYETGGKIGVGTTTPVSTLHVIGTGEFSTSASSTRFFANIGSETVPSYSFPGNFTNYGMFKDSSNRLAFSVAGTSQTTISATQFVIASTRLQVQDGTAANPSYAFSSDLDTGIYYPATNALGITSSGTLRMYFDGSGRIGVGTSTPSAMFHISGASTTTAPFRIGASGAPASPNFGNIWNDSDQNALTFQSSSTMPQYLASNMFVATTDKVINATASTTAFSSGVGTTTIPAGYLKVGKSFSIWGSGYYSTPIGNTATVSILVKIGATNVSTITTGIFPASAVNLPFDFMLNCTVRSVGSSGTAVCDGDFLYATALSGVAKTSNSLATIGTVTIDTTVANKLDVLVSWSTVTTQTATVQEAKINFDN